jgi:hypothetical protein
MVKAKLPFACGNTRVYFRAGALGVSGNKASGTTTHNGSVFLIQSCIPTVLRPSSGIALMRVAAIRIQTMARGHLELKRYQEKKLACIRLAAWVRGRQATALVQGIREK